jgi:3'(2'), 5'-bisphosphate nucleotidase
MENLNLLAHKVIEISRLASDAIMEIYNKNDFKVVYKGDDSPVTIADYTSNKIINEALSKLTPDIPIISEENEETPFEIRKNYTYCWLVDPLDGTKEFVGRNGEFAVNIALIYQNCPILGVVWVPVTEGGYYAVKGQGSFYFKNNVEKQIHCSRFKITDKGLKVPISRSFLTKQTKDLINHFDTPQLLPLGSALKFIQIAEGKADIYPRIGTTMEWDTAATQIIVEEAGGQIIDLYTKTSLTYNKPSLYNPDFVAHGIFENDINNTFFKNYL